MYLPGVDFTQLSQEWALPQLGQEGLVALYLNADFMSVLQGWIWGPLDLFICSLPPLGAHYSHLPLQSVH